MFQIGKITQAFGLKGEVKILSLTDYDRFNKNNVIYVTKDNEYVPLTIERSRFSKARYIVKFKEINDINDLGWLLSSDIYAPKLISDNEDEFHFADLINKDVCLSDESIVGKVLSVMVVPQGHILEIQTLEDKRVLIPFVKAYVGPISDKSITIYPIEGML